MISGRSTEAPVDMAEALAQRLAKANRLRGRRMEIITQKQPELYRSNSCQLEEVIENNYGGVLFIDEAYSLCDSYENGFGDEALTTIEVSDIPDPEVGRRQEKGEDACV